MIDPLFESVRRKIAVNVIEKHKDFPREKLQKIVKEYESVPWYKKIMRSFWSEGWPSEEYFTYLFARDSLNGKFNYKEWKKEYDEELRLEEEKQAGYAKERLEERIKQENIEKGRKVELFPGSLEEYERFRGKSCEIMDTGKRWKYFCIWAEADYHELGKLGADTLIRYHPTQNWGMPVKVKNNKSQHL